MRERDHMQDLGVVGRVTKCGVGAWVGLIRLRIETGGGAFVNAVMTLRFQ